MILAGRTAIFRLTEAGQAEFSADASEDGLLEAFVVETESFGAFVIPKSSMEESSVSVMLLKWEFVSGALVHWKPSTPAPKTKIGFGS